MLFSLFVAWGGVGLVLGLLSLLFGSAFNAARFFAGAALCFFVAFFAPMPF